MLLPSMSWSSAIDISMLCDGDLGVNCCEECQTCRWCGMKVLSIEVFDDMMLM